MYLWSIKNLKNDLISNLLTENYKFFYFFIFVLLFTLFSEIGVFIPSESNIIDKVQSIVSICIVIFGLVIAYRVNGGNAGKDFLTRAISLYVVLSIRFIAFTLVAIASYSLFLWAMSLVIPNQYMGDVANGVTVVFMPLFEILFYWRFIIHIRDVRKGELKT